MKALNKNAIHYLFYNDITPRGIEVFQLVALGLSNAEIAKQLKVSVPTIKGHLGMMFKKLEIKSRAQLIVLAWKLNEEVITADQESL